MRNGATFADGVRERVVRFKKLLSFAEKKNPAKRRTVVKNKGGSVLCDLSVSVSSCCLTLCRELCYFAMALSKEHQEAGSSAVLMKGDKHGCYRPPGSVLI
jgi:hypothetical protein